MKRNQAKPLTQILCMMAATSLLAASHNMLCFSCSSNIYFTISRSWDTQISSNTHICVYCANVSTEKQIIDKANKQQTATYQLIPNMSIHCYNLVHVNDTSAKKKYTYSNVLTNYTKMYKTSHQIFSRLTNCNYEINFTLHITKMLAEKLWPGSTSKGSLHNRSIGNSTTSVCSSITIKILT